MLVSSGSFYHGSVVCHALFGSDIHQLNPIDVKK